RAPADRQSRRRAQAVTAASVGVVEAAVVAEEGAVEAGEAEFAERRFSLRIYDEECWRKLRPEVGPARLDRHDQRHPDRDDPEHDDDRREQPVLLVHPHLLVCVRTERIASLRRGRLNPELPELILQVVATVNAEVY